MYRKPGSPGVLKGVHSGPYAGGRKLVDAAKLPRAARQRLADVLTGRADPTPILHEHPRGLASRFRATWGILAASIGLTTLVAIGFADPRAAWAYQPKGLAFAYAAGGMLFAASLLSLYRRRALASGDALVPGRYLLPLDVVEVPPEDAAGDQVIVVTPLGDGRDARVRTGARESELVLTLEGGAEVAFTLRNEREGEHALRRLEHAQVLLEELTYGRELEKALANDAFFDVRVDASWESLVPSGPVSGATRRRKAFLHGSLAMAGALIAGGALGWAAFTSRSWASDRALYLRALRGGTTESLEQYLARGTSHREEATALRDRLNEQRADLARAAAQSRARSRTGFESAPRSEWELTPEEAAARRGSAEACIASVRARAATARPEVTAIMEQLVARARRTGDPVIPVRVDAHAGSRPGGVPESDHATRSAHTIRTFERIFSETCPASLVRFALRPADPTNASAPGLDVKIDATWPTAPTWKHGSSATHAPTIVFDVTLRGAAINDVASFHLTMSPPETPPTEVRARSIFAGVDDADVYGLLSARAFDRLYDELYGLFFRGDPRVPITDHDEP
ncbi:MAG: hypothetical protein JWP87_1720 [Labilithrix sp.]|nr:hypothetical protein [Labilithrix sp.]